MSRIPPEAAEHINHLHVMPANDEVEHVSNDSCICGPTTEPVFRADGSNGWLSVHHSLDRREARE